MTTIVSAKFRNKFIDKQFYRRRELMGKNICREKVSKTPNLIIHNQQDKYSESNQIQISVKEIMITIKTKLLKEAYFAFKRLFHIRPKLLITKIPFVKAP